MNINKKILLSIPSVFNAVIYLIITFPQETSWLISSMDRYHYLVIFGLILRVFNYSILTKVLWSYKNISKAIKSKWAWFMFLFNPLASLVLIWKKFDEFEIENANMITDDHY